MEEIKREIGRGIKELRIKNLKMSQDDFAQLLGVDRTYLSRIESGKQNNTVNTLSEICSSLGVSLIGFFPVFE